MFGMLIVTSRSPLETGVPSPSRKPGADRGEVELPDFPFARRGAAGPFGDE